MARASTGTPGATTLSTARAAISATSISATNNLNTSAPPLCAPRMGPLSLCFARRFRKDHSGGLHNLSIRSAGVQPGATLAERPRGDPGRPFLPEKLLFELLARGPLREPAVFVLLVGAVTGILTAAVAILSGRHLRPDGLDGSRIRFVYRTSFLTAVGASLTGLVPIAVAPIWLRLTTAGLASW